MDKKRILHSEKATQNLNSIIKNSVGLAILILLVIYLVFVIKPNFDQIKEIMTYIIVYLLGYGTKRGGLDAD